TDPRQSSHACPLRRYARDARKTARMRPLSSRLILVCTCLLGAACSGRGATEPPGDGRTVAPADTTCAAGMPMPETELFFGFDRKGMPPVGAAEWQDFVDTVITPRFQDGLTTFQASGQWQSMKMVIKEETRVVVVIHDGSAKALADL